jgi:ankyrin repeat protein
MISSSSRPFPSDPSLEFDRKQAKQLLAMLRAADPDAARRFAGHHPHFDPKMPHSMQLSDAQLVVAREYGLPSWRALVEKIESIELDNFKQAMRAKDVARTRRLLRRSESLRARINDPMFDFGRRAVHVASSDPALMDVLLEFGADINRRSDWENGPYTVLDDCPPDAARQLIARGATLTAHAAARLGWIDELRRLLDDDRSLVHEKGGDGQRPLHFARTPQIVDLLLERGAEIDARCVDHHSTAAQYALVERPDVCRRLLERGATPDIFMPARLGDPDLARHLIESDRSCLAARVNTAGYPPVVPFNIYCWTLGWGLSPHEVALRFGHREMYELFVAESPADVRLLEACSRADEAAARATLAEHPGLVQRLRPQDQSLLPFSMFHGRVESVRLMLSLGFDPMARGTDDGTLLHMACWHGNEDITSLLLRDHRDRIELDDRDATHDGTPLGWAVHGSLNSPHKHQGRYAAVVRMLLEAGAAAEGLRLTGTDAVEEVLRQSGVRKT